MSGRAASDDVISGRCAISVGNPGTALPGGWTRAPLTSVADLGTGHTPSRKHPEYWNGDIPWIGIRDAGAHHGGVINDTLQRINQLGLDNSSARLLPKDTVCLSRTASVGYVIKLGRAMATSQDFVTWSCSEALDPDFLMQALLAEGADIRRFGEGSTHTTIYFPEVKAFHITLPPLPEQQRIVAKIDSLTGKSKRARDHLDHIPRLVEKYKQAVLAAAFRGDLTREWRRTQQVLEETPVQAEIEVPYRQSFTAPSSWRRMRFEDVCTIEGGSQPPKSNFEYAPAAHLIRFVQIRDYKSDERVTYIPKALARRFCSADDIMIGRYGPPIFQILRGIEGSYNVALMKAVPNERLIEREYLYRYLNYPALRSYVEFEAQRTAGQDGVNKRHLLAWPVLAAPACLAGLIATAR